MSNIGRKTKIAPQNVQHFMSNSPWCETELVRMVQQKVSQHPEFQQGAILLVDGSAAEKTGEQSAGAGRQHNGRLGKIELSQVGVFVSLTTMAWRKSHRYFVENSNQTAKSQLGWDEFQAIKYRAWQHQLALTILASWFVTETRLDWAAMPLPQLSPTEPALLVIEHFDNRTRSRKSRLPYGPSP